MTCYAPRTRARGRGVRLPGRSWIGVACVVGVTGLGLACASGTGPPHVTLPSHSPTPAPTPDPADAVVAKAEARLQSGLAAAAEGHLDRARAEFDAAVDVLLSFPGGAFADPRVAEAYRRTLDTVHVRELEMLAEGDGFTEAGTEPASIDAVGALPVGDSPASAETRARAVAAVEAESLDLAGPAERAGPLLHRPLSGAPARLVRDRALARAEVPPAHPRGVRRGGNPAGPRLRRARRERLQDDRLLAGEGEGRVAVRERDGQALRPRGRLVGGRAERPREGDPRRGALPEGAPRPLRGLEPRPRRLQRGGRQGPPRRETVQDRRLLEAPGDAGPASGDEELRAPHPRRGRPGEGPGAVRLHGHPRRAPRLRARSDRRRDRPPRDRRVRGRASGGHPRPEPRAAAPRDPGRPHLRAARPGGPGPGRDRVRGGTCRSRSE